MQPTSRLLTITLKLTNLSSKKQDWIYRGRKEKQKEKGKNSWQENVNVKISKSTQRMHWTWYSNLCKGSKDTTDNLVKRTSRTKTDTRHLLTQKMLKYWENATTKYVTNPSQSTCPSLTQCNDTLLPTLTETLHLTKNFLKQYKEWRLMKLQVKQE